MIRVHIYDWVTCSWRYVWRPSGVVRAMRHLTFGATIACTGITVYPPSPPVEAHPPPPPAETIVAPPPPVGYFPPPWSFVPPANSYTPLSYPIPVGPVQPGPPVERQTLIGPADFHEAPHGYVPAVADVAPSQTPNCNEDVPPSHVAEPGALSVFVMGLLILGIWHVLGKYER